MSEDKRLAGTAKRLAPSALQLGPKKKMLSCVFPVQDIMALTFRSQRCIADPLIHHGRHFGRTVHALCNVQALLTNGLLRLGELAAEPEESFTYE
jgi:hypothetical protein